MPSLSGLVNGLHRRLTADGGRHEWLSLRGQAPEGGKALGCDTCLLFLKPKVSLKLINLLVHQGRVRVSRGVR